MINASYLKKKHMEAFKEEVRAVSQKAVNCVDSGVDIDKLRQEVGSATLIPLSESVSTTSLPTQEVFKDAEAQVPRARVDEINSEPGSVLGSPRTEVGGDVTIEQQLEAAIALPSAAQGKSANGESAPSTEAPRNGATPAVVPALSGVSGYVLQRSPSGSSVASLGSIGSVVSQPGGQIQTVPTSAIAGTPSPLPKSVAKEPDGHQSQKYATQTIAATMPYLPASSAVPLSSSSAQNALNGQPPSQAHLPAFSAPQSDLTPPTTSDANLVDDPLNRVYPPTDTVTNLPETDPSAEGGFSGARSTTGPMVSGESVDLKERPPTISGHQLQQQDDLDPQLVVMGGRGKDKNKATDDDKPPPQVLLMSRGKDANHIVDLEKQLTAILSHAQSGVLQSGVLANGIPVVTIPLTAYDPNAAEGQIGQDAGSIHYIPRVASQMSVPNDQSVASGSVTFQPRQAATGDVVLLAVAQPVVNSIPLNGNGSAPIDPATQNAESEMRAQVKVVDGVAMTTSHELCRSSDVESLVESVSSLQSENQQQTSTAKESAADDAQSKDFELQEPVPAAGVAQEPNRFSRFQVTKVLEDEPTVAAANTPNDETRITSLVDEPEPKPSDGRSADPDRKPTVQAVGRFQIMAAAVPTDDEAPPVPSSTYRQLSVELEKQSTPVKAPAAAPSADEAPREPFLDTSDLHLGPFTGPRPYSYHTGYYPYAEQSFNGAVPAYGQTIQSYQFVHDHQRRMDHLPYGQSLPAYPTLLSRPEATLQGGVLENLPPPQQVASVAVQQPPSQKGVSRKRTTSINSENSENLSSYYGEFCCVLRRPGFFEGKWVPGMDLQWPEIFRLNFIYLEVFLSAIDNFLWF